MQLALETGGQSLTEGIRLFFEDVAKWRISMTDESAFEVGRKLATTEGAVILENDLVHQDLSKLTTPQSSRAVEVS